MSVPGLACVGYDPLEAAVRNAFANGEKGVVFDPSDFSTMWQDSAGTTPVTAVGQTVGKILDKSPNAAHATQSTAAYCPILGREPLGGVRNLVASNSDVSSTAPTLNTTYVTKSDSSVAAPLGGTALLLTETNDNNQHYIIRSIAASTVGQAHTLSIYAKTNGRRYLGLYYGVDFCAFDLVNGVKGVVGSGCTTSITSVGGGWYRCSVSGVLADKNILIFLQDIGNYQSGYQGDGVSGIYIQHLQGELGSTATAYQKVVDQYDVTEAGKRNLYYLQGAATKCLATPSIDFSGGDKLAVFAGIRKEQDAAKGTVVGLSAAIASNNGSMALWAPSGAASDISYGSKGTTEVDVTTTSITAPIKEVVTCISDISGPSNKLRLNGSEAVSTDTQGTGNLGNYPIYLMSTGGASNYFIGKAYAWVVRAGIPTSAQVAAIEAYINLKLGAY